MVGSKGSAAGACNPSTREGEVGGSEVKASPNYSQTSVSEQRKQFKSISKQESEEGPGRFKNPD